MNKLTKLEKYWVLYDVGNSAFVLLVSTIIPIYFKNLATEAGISLSDSTAYYSYAISILCWLILRHMSGLIKFLHTDMLGAISVVVFLLQSVYY